MQPQALRQDHVDLAALCLREQQVDQLYRVRLLRDLDRGEEERVGAASTGEEGERAGSSRIPGSSEGERAGSSRIPGFGEGERHPGRAVWSGEWRGGAASRVPCRSCPCLVRSSQDFEQRVQREGDQPRLGKGGAARDHDRISAREWAGCGPGSWVQGLGSRQALGSRVQGTGWAGIAVQGTGYREWAGFAVQ